MSALTKQEGGSHYKDMKIQPVEFIHANNIPFIEGCIIKYASRWRDKNGISDLRKIIHFAELLIELEEKKTINASDYVDIKFDIAPVSATGHTHAELDHLAMGGNLSDLPLWYPDDSGEWVEVDPGQGMPKGLGNCLVECLLGSERSVKEYSPAWSFAKDFDTYWAGTCGGIVAYKKVTP